MDWTLNKFINKKIIIIIITMVDYGTDLKLDFESNDIFIGGNDDFSLVSSLDNVEQAIKTRLLTKIGTLETHPTFGSKLYLLIGSTMDDETINTAGSYVHQALANEPRIKEISSLTVDYRVIGTKKYLIIFLEGTLISTDVPLNLVVNYEV